MGHKKDTGISGFFCTSCFLACIGTVQGGRYSDPSELNKLVIPLVIVAVILVLMLTLVGVFYLRKRRCQCTCCALLVQSRHSLMKDQTHCHCGDTCGCLNDGKPAREPTTQTQGAVASKTSITSVSGVAGLPSKTYTISSDSHSSAWGKDGGTGSLDCGPGLKNEAKCSICCRCEENVSQLRSRSPTAAPSHSGSDPQLVCDKPSPNSADMSNASNPDKQGF